MKPAARLALVALFIGAGSFGVARDAAAQNTDEAHAECAQGGGVATFSGAGEPNVRGIDNSARRPRVVGLQSFGILRAVDDESDNGASGGAGGGGGGDGGGSGSGDASDSGNLSEFAHEAANAENEAGAGGGGGGTGGLGGSSFGGGAGGCGDEFPRKLPATGPSTQIAYMGSAFVAVGLLMLLTTRRLGRAAAPQGMVWDTFASSD